MFEFDFVTPVQRAGDSVGFMVAMFWWLSVLLMPIFVIVLRAL